MTVLFNDRLPSIIKMSRTRNFCFTLNNYTEDVYQALLAVECKYVCIGKEIAPETATPHLQGFIVFKNARTLASLKKLDARARGRFVGVRRNRTVPTAPKVATSRSVVLSLSLRRRMARLRRPGGVLLLTSLSLAIGMLFVLSILMFMQLASRSCT